MGGEGSQRGVRIEPSIEGNIGGWHARRRRDTSVLGVVENG
jgi:hypothetical protein